MRRRRRWLHLISGEKVTLRVSTFGKFGYTDLYKQYMKDHPNVTVVETAEGDLGKYNTQLIQRIAAGSGAGDVVAIEEGQVVNFLQSADKFVNLQKYGSNELKDNWLPWKYANATTADGATTIGLGTDVGGLAMCYRKDLFEKAGLPTDRAEVGKLWPTWDDYIATGQKYQAGIKDAKSHFVDSATNTYNSILMQSGDHTYFDRERRARHRHQPRGQVGLGRVPEDGRRGPVGQAQVVLARVERRVQERLVRHPGLPRVDDRLHQGPGRRGEHRQVGHHHDPRWRRQLGRLLARGADAEQAPEGSRRARQVPHHR